MSEVDAVHVTDLEVRGQKFPIAVTGSGRFVVEAKDVGLADMTLEGLRKKLMDRTKQKQTRVNVRFVIQRGQDGLMRGVATGFHATNNDMLVKLEDGKPTQANFYTVLRDLTDDEFEAGSVLAQAVLKADDEWRAFENQYKMNLRAAIQEAIRLSDD